jgi:hypothetical protein
MSKIIANLINLLYSSKNCKMTTLHIVSSRAFQQYQKYATRAPWFQRVKVWSQTKQKPLYTYIYNPINGIIFKALRVRTNVGWLSGWAC